MLKGPKGKGKSIDEIAKKYGIKIGSNPDKNKIFAVDDKDADNLTQMGHSNESSLR